MSSSEDIRVKAGEPIPLRAQETGGITDKVIKATIYSDKEMTDVLAGPINLAHRKNGFYANDSVAMPSSLLRVYAQYLVFDSDGTTPNTDGDKAVTDVFAAIEEAGAVLQAVGIPEGIVESTILEVVGEVEQGDTSEGIVESGEDILGLTDDQDEVHGEAASDESIFGQVESNQSTVGETGGC